MGVQTRRGTVLNNNPILRPRRRGPARRNFDASPANEQTDSVQTGKRKRASSEEKKYETRKRLRNGAPRSELKRKRSPSDAEDVDNGATSSSKRRKLSLPEVDTATLAPATSDSVPPASTMENSSSPSFHFTFVAPHGPRNDEVLNSTLSEQQSANDLIIDHISGLGCSTALENTPEPSTPLLSPISLVSRTSAPGNSPTSSVPTLFTSAIPEISPEPPSAALFPPISSVLSTSVPVLSPSSSAVPEIAPEPPSTPIIPPIPLATSCSAIPPPTGSLPGDSASSLPSAGMPESFPMPSIDTPATLLGGDALLATIGEAVLDSLGGSPSGTRDADTTDNSAPTSVASLPPFMHVNVDADAADRPMSTPPPIHINLLTALGPLTSSPEPFTAADVNALAQEVPPSPMTATVGQEMECGSERQSSGQQDFGADGNSIAQSGDNHKSEMDREMEYDGESESSGQEDSDTNDHGGTSKPEEKHGKKVDQEMEYDGESESSDTDDSSASELGDKHKRPSRSSDLSGRSPSGCISPSSGDSSSLIDEDSSPLHAGSHSRHTTIDNIVNFTNDNTQSPSPAECNAGPSSRPINPSASSTSGSNAVFKASRIWPSLRSTAGSSSGSNNSPSGLRSESYRRPLDISSSSSMTKGSNKNLGSYRRPRSSSSSSSSDLDMQDASAKPSTKAPFLSSASKSCDDGPTTDLPPPEHRLVPHRSSSSSTSSNEDETTSSVSRESSSASSSSTETSSSSSSKTSSSSSSKTSSSSSSSESSSSTSSSESL
ncbi:hypothetical protein AAF712_007580 [Marasmius tenuissimus]|uniref:Uncharacterized protein n=1 Tax=Marasmius tenuissimus TaxID=585030 RepID=A0ABR2ZVP5_9AGAR